ncbi:MAG TPA: ergothioneine biosynthesis protein EgtB [Solirubrobacteraceae bacterium]|nr:ergothioneine biosynthesis protein EgtB [Solirubrobacteraceae bacterium]
MTGSTAATTSPAAARMIQALEEGRRRTLALVASLSDADLERVHSPLMSPLVWDLAHIAAYEDLWLVHRYGERPLLREDLAATYDAFETPRACRGDIELLGPGAARRYLSEVRARVLEVIDERGVGDGLLHEMVLRHEHQHNETMFQTLQLARLPHYELAGRRREPGAPSEAYTGLELIAIPAGPCTIGAPPDGFAYDNERARHRVDVGAFEIGCTPVTNGAYLRFVRDGGYEQREWWSAEGWAWKDEFGISGPGAWTDDHAGEWRLGRLEPLHPDRPVVHVTWYEADAFARAHGARLPTEIEWEKAASWDESAQAARPYPWGSRRPAAGLHANLDQRGCGTVPVGAYPAGASPYGCLGMLGDVWEWTSSLFDGYPGFVPHPYREYSEVFFGDEYMVLRGGSWATRSRVATATFRNWDYPQRRQIFAGFRIARDV